MLIDGPALKELEREDATRSQRKKQAVAPPLAPKKEEAPAAAEPAKPKVQSAIASEGFY